MAGNKDSGNHGRYGKDAPNWRGGEHIDSSGHMRVWVREQKRYVPRAHLVWFEAHPGDVIPRGYVIHHRDGNKLNDVIENLEKIPLASHVARHRREMFKYIEQLQGIIRDLGGEYPALHGDDDEE